MYSPLQEIKVKSICTANTNNCKWFVHGIVFATITLMNRNSFKCQKDNCKTNLSVKICFDSVGVLRHI